MLVLYLIVIFALLSAISGLFMYLICLVFKVYVSDVQIFYCTLKKIKVGDTEIRFGWLPVGSYITPKGYTENDESPITEYDLRRKNTVVKILLDSAAFISTAAIALLYYCFIYKTFGNITIQDIYCKIVEISLDSFTSTHEQLILLMFVFASLFSLSNLILFIPKLAERLKIIKGGSVAIKTTLYGFSMLLYLTAFIYLIYEVIA